MITSKNVPLPGIVEEMFRNPGLAGVIDKVNGIAFGRSEATPWK